MISEFIKRLGAYLRRKKEYIQNKYNKTALKSRREIKKLKGFYSGKRCFIIGNGPSIRIGDLESLKDEYTFAFNKIYCIFEETSFRPVFYFAQDSKVLQQMSADLPDINKAVGTQKVFFPTSVRKYGLHYKDNKTYFYLDQKIYKQKKFSADVSKRVYEGSTVTYTAMQFAVYMGFKEIYLIGIDHNYSNVMTAEGNVIHNNTKNYFSEKYVVENAYPAYLYDMEAAYTAARKYADQHAIKIYNATRGGKLEVFERVNLDDILKCK